MSRIPDAEPLASVKRLRDGAEFLPNDGSRIRLRPEWLSHFWSYDFVQHRTQDERPIRLPFVIDELVRRWLAIGDAWPLRSDDVLQYLTDFFGAHGPPELMRIHYLAQPALKSGKWQPYSRCLRMKDGVTS